MTRGEGKSDTVMFVIAAVTEVSASLIISRLRIDIRHFSQLVTG